MTHCDEAGAGAGASRLVCGTHRHHQRLEEALSRFKQTEAALEFFKRLCRRAGNNPRAGWAMATSLFWTSCVTLVLSMVRVLSGASIRVFPHNRIETLESHLRWAAEKHPDARVLVLVESVYSMDGDRAPVASRSSS